MSNISITNPNTDFVKKIQLEKEEKGKVYEAAKEQEAIYIDSLWRAENEYNSVKAEYEKNGKTSSKYNQLRNKYISALSSRKNAEFNTDIARSSYQDSIFYAGKINNAAIIGNAINA